MSNVTKMPFAGSDRQRPPRASGRAERAAAIAAMVAHPAMPEAMRITFGGLVGVAQGNRLLGLIASDRSRILMAWLALYLDAGYDGRDPRSGLTVNRYKSLCASSGRCSPGRAVAMLGLMRFAGHLEPATRAVRGLPLRLVPTEKLLGPQRQRLRVALTAMTKVRPEGAIGLVRFDDPVFVRTLVRHCSEQFLAREPLLDHGPGVRFFIDRKAGFMMLMALALSGRPGDDVPPVEPVPVAIKPLAQRLGVARSQVREMLRSGVTAGLLAAGRGEAVYTIAPQLRADLIGVTAAMFLLIADAVTLAQNEIEAGPQPLDGVA